jgi:hypothetical protein
MSSGFAFWNGQPCSLARDPVGHPRRLPTCDSRTIDRPLAQRLEVAPSGAAYPCTARHGIGSTPSFGYPAARPKYRVSHERVAGAFHREHIVAATTLEYSWLYLHFTSSCR